jgi:hypothetical protein
MTDDPVAAYARARAAYALAERDLMRHVYDVQEVSNRLLRNPRYFAFAGIRPPAPAALAARIRSRNFDRPDIMPAAKWPSAETIQQTIVTWHAAREALDAAYAAIPNAQREAVVEPPELPFRR